MNQRCQEHEQLACPVCNHTPMPLTWLIASARELAKQHLEMKFGTIPHAKYRTREAKRFALVWTNAIRVQTLKNLASSLDAAYKRGYEDGATIITDWRPL